MAGGLAFAIAPYRVEQSVGHLLGPISILLPASLWAFERARRGNRWWLALAGAALASIPLSGQVHLALGAIPFFFGYALCRTRDRRLWLGAGAGAITAIGAGLVVRQTVIEQSTQSGGRSLGEISHYSARVGDLVSRHVDHSRSEQFVFLGWATPLVAFAGLVLLIRARRYSLAAILGLGALVPIVLALGTRTPIYTALWHALPPFRFPRVPERLLPIACLCIAALFAYTVAQSRRTFVTVLAIALLFVDLHVRVYGKSAPGDPAGAVPSAAGRLLELPVFDPGVHYGSVYLWYDTAAQRQRPGGYSTTAPKPAKAIADRLERLNCGDWSGNMSGELNRLGVGAIALHRGLYVRNPAVPARAAQHAGTARAWLASSADNWACLAVRARRHRHRAEASRACALPSRLLPGVVRRHGLGPVHERDARTVLDLRKRNAGTRVRSVSAHAACDDRRSPRARPPLEGLAPCRSRCRQVGEGRGRETEGRTEATEGDYIPIAWYPESTYSVVPVTFLAASERR